MSGVREEMTKKITLPEKMHCNRCNRRIADELGERFVVCSCCCTVTSKGLSADF